MKSVLVLIVVAFTTFSPGDSITDFKCPQTYLPKLKPVTLNNVLGIWFVVRATPNKDQTQHPDCITHTLWKTQNTSENQINTLSMTRENGTLRFEQNVATVKLLPTLGKIDNHWSFEFRNMTFNSVFVDSDNGKSWAIGHACVEMDNNLTSMWVLMSRGKKMDPKLEQTVVEKIEKYSGLTQNILRGIRHMGCYGEK